MFIGGFFLWSGIQKALTFPGLVEFFARAQYPTPLAIASFVVALETLCGICIVANVGARIAALLLSGYVLVTSTLFFSSSTAASVQLFLQNMAILGGLVLVASMNRAR